MVGLLCGVLRHYKTWVLLAILSIVVLIAIRICVVCGRSCREIAPRKQNGMIVGGRLCEMCGYSVVVLVVLVLPDQCTIPAVPHSLEG